MGQSVKYLAGSRYAHDRQAIQRKLEEITPFLAALTERRAELGREVHCVVVSNKDNGRSVVVSVRDTYQEAYTEAQLCFSAMHELKVGFGWKIRVERVVLKAEDV